MKRLTQRRALLAGMAAASLSLGGALPAAAAPPPRQTYELQLTYLQVDRTNEIRDEVELTFNNGQRDQKLWYGENLDKGDIRDLGNTTVLFTNRETPTLRATEIDCSCFLDPDDPIGSPAEVPKQEVNNDEAHFTFEGDGALYQVYYKVVKA